MSAESDRLQLMHMSRQLLTVELDDIASKYAIDPIATVEAEEEVVENEGYYLQFPAELRTQASEMARYYQIFYCLENSIRDMVESQLAEGFGEAWWDEHAPENIRTTVAQNKKREQDNGVTLRSSHPIDYTTFGELGEIIKSNWDIFGSTFNSKRGLEKVISSLNLLRGPIAHCSPLAEDEVVRLHLAVRDYYRLME
ncbi:Swt1 family HEPN domain-containing protein [Lacisediminihabitans sp. H27-G8]|uniref:Swt1 family HEPN domain-containing protein n=1 Tax=Lacisediminihabitans sp. H27-G8 TaxID=3111909 RepID=UPI0038FD24B7